MGDLIWLTADVSCLSELPDSLTLARGGPHETLLSVDLRTIKALQFAPWPCIVRDVISLKDMQPGSKVTVTTSGVFEIEEAGNSVWSIEETLSPDQLSSGKTSIVWPINCKCEILGIRKTGDGENMTNKKKITITVPELLAKPLAAVEIPDAIWPLVEDLRQWCLQENDPSGKLWLQRFPVLACYIRALVAVRRHLTAAVCVSGDYSIIDSVVGGPSWKKTLKKTETAFSESEREVSRWSHRVLQWGGEVIQLGDVVRVLSGDVKTGRRTTAHTYADASNAIPMGQSLLQIIAIEWDPNYGADSGKTTPNRTSSFSTSTTDFASNSSLPSTSATSSLRIIGCPCIPIDAELVTSPCHPVWGKVMRLLTGKSRVVSWTRAIGDFAKSFSCQNDEQDRISAGPASSTPDVVCVGAERLLGKFHGFWPELSKPSRLPPLPSNMFADLGVILPKTDPFLTGRLDQSSATMNDPTLNLERYWPL